MIFLSFVNSYKNRTQTKEPRSRKRKDFSQPPPPLANTVPLQKFHIFQLDSAIVPPLNNTITALTD